MRAGSLRVSGIPVSPIGRVPLRESSQRVGRSSKFAFPACRLPIVAVRIPRRCAAPLSRASFRAVVLHREYVQS